MSFIRTAVNAATAAFIFAAGYYTGKKVGENEGGLKVQVEEMLGHHNAQMTVYRALHAQVEEILNLPADITKSIKVEIEHLQESMKAYLDAIDFTGSTKKFHDAANKELKKILLHIADIKKGNSGK